LTPLLIVVAVLAGCSTSTHAGKQPVKRPPGDTLVSAGDKMLCDVFQVLADKLTARDAAGSKAALQQLRTTLNGATSTQLKKDATGLAQATDGATAATYARKIPTDCKLAGQTLAHP
jgi:hypothetical protein